MYDIQTLSLNALELKLLKACFCRDAKQIGIKFEAAISTE